MSRLVPGADPGTAISRIAAVSVVPALTGLALVLAGCILAPGSRPFRPVLHYVGSSTVGIFVRDAAPLYPGATFTIRTDVESEGGEKAILDGSADVAGTAREPRLATEEKGVEKALIGRDAIAVLVHESNPITTLRREDLARIFTGQVRNWAAFGGPDRPITPCIVGEESATRQVFRDAVLGGRPPEGCRVVRPDRDILRAVAGDPGGIGTLSFSFLGENAAGVKAHDDNAAGVKAIAVDGAFPSVTNFDYPISRPLYVLWREGDSDAAAFAAWARGDAGQRIVLRHFVGIRAVGSVRESRGPAPAGTLIVETETEPFDDGGILYYPHRPYEILDERGALLRRVPNHRGRNDEHPAEVSLPAGTYLIRADSPGGEPIEFYVTIEVGKTTRVDVEELPERHP